jgi:hypothetical protein
MEPKDDMADAVANASSAQLNWAVFIGFPKEFAIKLPLIFPDRHNKLHLGTYQCCPNGKSVVNYIFRN